MQLGRRRGGITRVCVEASQSRWNLWCEGSVRMGKERVDKHHQWPGPGVQLQPLCCTWCHITSPKHFCSPRSWSGCVGADYSSSKTEIINSTILLCAASSSGYWHGPSSELSPWERVWITANQGQKKNCRITQFCQPQPGLQILIRFLFGCFFLYH